jgi:hypothetical protein
VDTLEPSSAEVEREARLVSDKKLVLARRRSRAAERCRREMEVCVECGGVDCVVLWYRKMSTKLRLTHLNGLHPRFLLCDVVGGVVDLLRSVRHEEAKGAQGGVFAAAVDVQGHLRSFEA